MRWGPAKRPPSAACGMVGNRVALEPDAPAHLHLAAARIETIRRYLADRTSPGAKPPPPGREEELAAELRRLRGALAAAGIAAE